MIKKYWSLVIGHWSFPTSSGGFTLIELLMVMAILSVIGGLFLATYPASQRRARDTQRKSDLKQYQTALESFANKNNGIFPSRTSGTDRADTTLCGDIGFAGDCPADPRDNENVCNSNTCRYYYRSDGSGGGIVDAVEYVLWGAIEQPVADDYWVACSSGKTGESSSTPTDGSCPI